jgi:hypothetical protein
VTTTEGTEAPKPQKKAKTREEAGLVEEGAEIQPQDEAITNEEWYDPESEATEVVAVAPSEIRVSGMSQEEQELPLTPVVVGPPAYGSPVPETAASRLLPLETHPLAYLPDDHPAKLDAVYGEGYLAPLSPEELGTQFPGAPGRSDLERDLNGEKEEREEEQASGEGTTTPPAEGGGTAPDYEAQTKDELLAEAQARGLSVNSSNTKAEIIAALQADDAA